MVQLLREFLTLFAPMVTIGVFLNALAPLRYKTQIKRFFENPKWQLGQAVASFIVNTFHRVFGPSILSLRFLITSLVFSIGGFLLFSAIFWALNKEPVCRYPIDWCGGIEGGLVRETILLMLAMVVIDVLSFAQTSLLINYAMKSERSYQLVFIAYADVVLSLSIFCFVVPAFLTFNFVVTPENEKRTDVFVALVEESTEKAIERLSTDLQKPIGPPESEPQSPNSDQSAQASDEDDDVFEDFSNGRKPSPSDDFSDLARAASAKVLDLRLYIRDPKRPERLYPAGNGPALAKGTDQELETLIRAAGARQGTPFVVEMRKIRFEGSKERRVLKSSQVALQQAPLLQVYSSLYQSVLNINHAFLHFLAGNPLFVDLNKLPFAQIANSMQTPDAICICPNGIMTGKTAHEFLNQDRYVVFDAQVIFKAAYVQILFERPSQRASLSVFFATSMFVTIVFYFGLLVFLLPAYLYREAFVALLGRLGRQGQKNAISIAIALGALPLAIFLVLLSRLI